ncbi:hypothetical protein C8024_05940 [Sphingopyxis sp. BSNA05]|nr:hypothetical protein [Sphingopyxis sp. BSNA05]
MALKNPAILSKLSEGRLSIAHSVLFTMQWKVGLAINQWTFNLCALQYLCFRGLFQLKMLSFLCKTLTPLNQPRLPATLMVQPKRSFRCYKRYSLK